MRSKATAHCWPHQVILQAKLRRIWYFWDSQWSKSHGRMDATNLTSATAPAATCEVRQQPQICRARCACSYMHVLRYVYVTISFSFGDRQTQVTGACGLLAASWTGLTCRARCRGAVDVYSQIVAARSWNATRTYQMGWRCRAILH